MFLVENLQIRTDKVASWIQFASYPSDPGENEQSYVGIECISPHNHIAARIIQLPGRDNNEKCRIEEPTHNEIMSTVTLDCQSAAVCMGSQRKSPGFVLIGQ